MSGVGAGVDPAAALRAQWGEPGAAAAIRELLEALGPQPIPSLVEALSALLAMVEDPQAVLPGSLSTALALTHERLSDLRLRKLLAQQENPWPQDVMAQGAAESGAASPVPSSSPGPLSSAESSPAPSSEPSPAPSPVPSPAQRNWWNVPVEGLGGANQLFVLETRELLRGADLSLQALATDPADYAEQMVLCRAFQAVAVAAASMGLHRLSAIAQAGEQRFDRLLDEGAPCEADLLRQTDEQLQQLFAELMELVGEPVPPAPQPPFEPRVEPLADPLPEPAAVPPWWWAGDWSRWSHRSHDAAASRGERPAEAMPTDLAAMRSEGTAVRVDASRLRGWAATLAGWHRALVESGADDASGGAPGVAFPLESLESLAGLRADIERAAHLSVDAWSVGLYRTLRRVARESSVELDFDLEGPAVAGEASSLGRFMPEIESLLSQRIAQGCGHLRLRASARDGVLTLQGLDMAQPPAATAWASPSSAWLAQCRALGGAWQTLPQGWQLALPQDPAWLPLLEVRAGHQAMHVPAAWCLRRVLFGEAELLQGLQTGSVDAEDGAWPLLRLSALVKVGALPVEASTVLFLEHGPQRLALQVEAVQALEPADVLPWPEGLCAWRERCGLWGAALHRSGRVLPVTDPFALARRYGAAARVLARGRAARGQPPDGALTTA